MQAIEETAANSEVIISPDVIRALQNFLARSRVIIPDLETPYSRSFNPDLSHAYESDLGDKSIDVVVAERQQQLRAVYRDITGLDKVMDRLCEIRQQLLEKQESIKQSAILHQGCTSGLWRLPVEVLCKIFVHCLPETDRLCISPNLAPLLLIRVCRRWKEVAENIPRLWCRLSVTTRVRRSWEETSFWHHLWLKRAQEHPLSLEILCSRDSSTQLKSFLQPYNTHITSLALILEDLKVAPEHLFQEIPALQELTIDWKWGHYRAAVEECISRLPCTLRALTLNGITVDPSMSSFPSMDVWTHLRNAKICLGGPYHLLQFLCLCPNLSLLDIYLDSDRNSNAVIQPLEPLTHTNLQSLIINWHNPKSLSDMFKALALPNLRVLEASRVGLPHDEVKAFLIRSKCPLERLTFRVRAGIIDEHRTEYIFLIPSLEVVPVPEPQPRRYVPTNWQEAFEMSQEDM